MPKHRNPDDGIPIRVHTRRGRSNLMGTAAVTAAVIGVALLGGGLVIWWVVWKPGNPVATFEQWQRAGREEDWSRFYDLMDESSQFLSARSLEVQLAEHADRGQKFRHLRGLKGKDLYLAIMADKIVSLQTRKLFAMWLVAPVVGVRTEREFADVTIEVPQSGRTETIHMKWQNGRWRVVCGFLL